MNLFIDDGYTRTATIEAVPGLHPGGKVEYRPALSLKRTEYSVVANSNQPAKINDYENDLIAKQVKCLDAAGHTGALAKAQAALIEPTLRNRLLNLILGFESGDEAGDEASDVGNSPGV